MQLVQKEFEQRMEELKRQHEEEFEARLDSNVKRILRQNRALAGELQLHVEETELLQLELKGAEQVRVCAKVSLHTTGCKLPAADSSSVCKKQWRQAGVCGS